MPFAMSLFIQSVEIDGNIYVGGGDTSTVDRDYVVMVCTVQSCQWHTLPPYCARYFAMSAIKNQLVLVGGDHKSNAIGTVGAWDNRKNQWSFPYPPMPTPRSSASAVSCQNRLVVAGGYDVDYLSAVEVLDVNTKQWACAQPTPKNWHRMKSVLIRDTWYLLGGWYSFSGVPDVYSVSVEALVSRSASDSHKTWRKLASLPYTCSCPLVLNESLYAYGGWQEGEPLSALFRYIPDTNTWIQAAEESPCGLYDSTCVSTSHEVFVLGGYNGLKGVSSVYKANF